MSNQREAVARKLAELRGHRDHEHEIVLQGGTRVPLWKTYLEDADAILSAIQPTVTEKAVEAAARAIGAEVGLKPFNLMAEHRFELRKLARSGDEYDINEPTQSDCRDAARAALTAALPFMMEKADG